MGSVIPDRDDLIGITYHDPSGEPVYCYHSELADFSLQYYRRGSSSAEWRLEEEMTAPGSSAFEYGSTEKLSGYRSSSTDQAAPVCALARRATRGRLGPRAVAFSQLDAIHSPGTARG